MTPNEKAAAMMAVFEKHGIAQGSVPTVYDAMMELDRRIDARLGEMESEVERLREALQEIAETYGDGVASMESRIARAALEDKR